MICRGIIESIINEYQVKVRIPLIHKAQGSAQSTNKDNLPIASICMLPNIKPNVKVGDIVIIGFENNDEGKPIILGYLYKQDMNNTEVSINLNSLMVTNSTRLSPDTSIGEISSSELEHLKGLKDNIQNQLNALTERIKNLEMITGEASNLQA